MAINFDRLLRDLMGHLDSEIGDRKKRREELALQEQAKYDDEQRWKGQDYYDKMLNEAQQKVRDTAAYETALADRSNKENMLFEASRGRVSPVEMASLPDEQFQNSMQAMYGNVNDMGGGSRSRGKSSGSSGNVDEQKLHETVLKSLSGDLKAENEKRSVAQQPLLTLEEYATPERMAARKSLYSPGATQQEAPYSTPMQQFDERRNAEDYKNKLHLENNLGVSFNDAYGKPVDASTVDRNQAGVETRQNPHFLKFSLDGANSVGQPNTMLTPQSTDKSIYSTGFGLGEQVRNRLTQDIMPQTGTPFDQIAPMANITGGGGRQPAQRPTVTPEPAPSFTSGFDQNEFTLSKLGAQSNPSIPRYLRDRPQPFGYDQYASSGQKNAGSPIFNQPGPFTPAPKQPGFFQKMYDREVQNSQRVGNEFNNRMQSIKSLVSPSNTPAPPKVNMEDMLPVVDPNVKKRKFKKPWLTEMNLKKYPNSYYTPR